MGGSTGLADFIALLILAVSNSTSVLILSFAPPVNWVSFISGSAERTCGEMGFGCFWPLAFSGLRFVFAA